MRAVPVPQKSLEAVIRDHAAAAGSSKLPSPRMLLPSPPAGDKPSLRRSPRAGQAVAALPALAKADGGVAGATSTSRPAPPPPLQSAAHASSGDAAKAASNQVAEFDRLVGDLEVRAALLAARKRVAELETKLVVEDRDDVDALPGSADAGTLGQGVAVLFLIESRRECPRVEFNGKCYDRWCWWCWWCCCCCHCGGGGGAAAAAAVLLS